MNSEQEERGEVLGGDRAPARVIETEFRWSHLPSEERRQMREEIVERITEDFPEEELTREFFGSLNEEQIGIIGEHLQAEWLESVREDPEDEMMAQQRNRETVERILDKALFEHPQATLYAIGLVILMMAFYLSSPLVALAGAAIILGTTLHYAD